MPCAIALPQLATSAVRPAPVANHDSPSGSSLPVASPLGTLAAMPVEPERIAETSYLFTNSICQMFMLGPTSKAGARPLMAPQEHRRHSQACPFLSHNGRARRTLARQPADTECQRAQRNLLRSSAACLAGGVGGRGVLHRQSRSKIAEGIWCYLRWRGCSRWPWRGRRGRGWRGTVFRLPR